MCIYMFHRLKSYKKEEEAGNGDVTQLVAIDSSKSTAAKYSDIVKRRELQHGGEPTLPLQM